MSKRAEVDLQDRLYHGNLDSERDWGHACDCGRGLREATAGRLREFYRLRNRELFEYLGREVDR